MRLKELIKGLKITKVYNLSDFEVKGVSDDSRKVKDGFLFVAVKGAKADGIDFINEAVKKGAGAIVTQCQVSSVKCQDKISVIKVKNTRSSLAKLAAKFYNYPAQKVKCIGVTGTNGKTTITYLLESIFKQARYSCGVVGTIDYHFKNKVFLASNTTPNPVFLQSLLKDMRDSKVSYCALEASSHSLAQERVGGIDFKYAIFTNLTSDHLDYHKSRHYYFAAKAKLFKMLNKEARAIINIDDSYGRKLLKLTKAKIVTYGIERRCDVRAEEIKLTSEGTEFKLKTAHEEFLVNTGLIGRHNIYNILAAVSVALTEGIEVEDIKKGISDLSTVAGRLEKVQGEDPFKVFVDYAHTEDALKNVLISLRGIKENKIITVFGCGGDRDRTKRPKMGQVAAKLSDFVIITNDNPRNEEPQKITKEIAAGIKTKNFSILPDRRAAIEHALSMAGAGDIVLIAGKGHEQYQIFKDKTVHFDDREAARKILDERRNRIMFKHDSLSGFGLSEILTATSGKFIYGRQDVFALRVSSDSRSINEGDLFIAIRGEKFDGHNFIAEALGKGARVVIVDNNFRLEALTSKARLKNYEKAAFVRVGDTVKALGDIAAFHRRRFNIPVIAITGSCGKTTTKDMLAEVLSSRFKVLKNEGTFNNFIGLPHTLLKLNKEFEIVVVEAGTNKRGEIKRLAEIAAPNAGIITNIGPSHLEFFGSVEAVLEEKYALVKNLAAPNIAILNGDDPRLFKKIKGEKEKVAFTFGIDNKCDLRATDVRIRDGAIDFMLGKRHKFRMNILGRHNIYNALAAASCGIIFGINFDDLKNRLAHFILPLTRINLRQVNGYKIIDDSYNSNPLSFACAIDTLKNFTASGRKVLVMGDMLELGEKSGLLHRQAGEEIIKAGLDTLITVGRMSLATAELVKSNNPDIKVYSCGCALEAKGILAGLLKPDDLVMVKGSRALEMEKAIQGL